MIKRFDVDKIKNLLYGQLRNIFVKFILKIKKN